MIKEEIQKYDSILNKDLCDCFDYYNSRQAEEIEFDIKQTNSFNENLEVLFDLDMNIPKNPYFQFFINYMNCSFKEKYYYLLVIKYLKIIIPKDQIINLYTLMNYLKVEYNMDGLSSEINYNNIKNNIKNRLTNINAKNILKYSLKALEANCISEIKDIKSHIEETNEDKSYKI